MAGTQGIYNAERTIYYLRILTQFLSQPQYKEVIKAIGLVNEPRAATLGHDPLASFNLRAYNVLREVTGFGEGNGPVRQSTLFCVNSISLTVPFSTLLSKKA
jgi:glucan 1,3-beta-glucosidase